MVDILSGMSNTVNINTVGSVHTAKSLYTRNRNVCKYCLDEKERRRKRRPKNEQRNAQTYMNYTFAVTQVFQFLSIFIVPTSYVLRTAYCQLLPLLLLLLLLQHSCECFMGDVRVERVSMVVECEEVI